MANVLAASHSLLAAKAMALYPCQCILTILSTPLELLEMEVDLLRQLDNVAVGFLELITLTLRKPPRTICQLANSG